MIHYLLSGVDVLEKVASCQPDCDCRLDVQHCEGHQRHGSIPERLAVGDDGTASPRPSSRSGMSTSEYIGIRQYTGSCLITSPNFTLFFVYIVFIDYNVFFYLLCFIYCMLGCNVLSQGCYRSGKSGKKTGLETGNSQGIRSQVREKSGNFDVGQGKI
ncbi:hypothetical protein J6590_100772 [Homalodisca vitripennis]|nr:hypothetical protein J6590_100772 [Homalodisca vitripennis]